MIMSKQSLEKRFRFHTLRDILLKCEQNEEPYSFTAKVMEFQLFKIHSGNDYLREEITTLRENFKYDKNYCLGLIQLSDNYHPGKTYQYLLPIASD